ncbi:MAG: hypothetical protein JJ971_09620 [Balneolaceae bacterium]|nr:hypothetical protein [Balneolaceae bacterium]MBO6546496.1 hypothetical protein [Balneolaceae bacterium]MBO6648855.1 hypothetical protein [Balneolaceae bacterium]
MRFLFSAVFILCSSSLLAQPVVPSSVAEMEASIKQRAELRASSIFKDFPIRSVGPVVMSGRVTDLAVHPDNPRVFYIGFGSGGVFKTTNSGNTMEPIFDHQDGALGVGDMELSRANPDILWVGTGENNSSRSTYAGTGIYKSMDAGETWTFSGLRGSQHIGRIVSHPTDENTVWVASLGALYSSNSVRGVYKTTDGGETWDRTLFINDSTGVVDLVIHPTNPDILWASAWEKDRKTWNFKESGAGSGIYKSTDGGENWTKITSGLPDGAHVGRIGLDISQSNPNILYASVDNQFETKTEVEESEGLTSADFVDMSKRNFLHLEDKELNEYLRSNRFPTEYTAASVKADVESDKYEPRALADYLGDANAALFNTSIKGLEVYRSNDGGESWELVNSYPLEGVVFTYGYYFGEIRVDPNDPETIYTWGVPLLKSTDGGKTWEQKADNQPVHVDHHAMWINPDDSEHILLGNDGGLYESHDGGENFIHHNVMAVGQFYTVNVDMEEPYNIYGGLQDNGTFMGPSTSTGDRNRPWTRIGGGDGMHVAPNPENPNIVYTGFQYGNYVRRDLENGGTVRITPVHDLGEARYRYNWNTPVNMSYHNPEIIYFGSQKLNRSFNEGKDWKAISPDLTDDLPNGDVPYSTLTTIAESPISFDVIWVGSDDGNIHVTTDAGNSWNKVSDNLPQRLWVSEIHASKYDERTAYVSLNGYRWDNFETHLYKTTDYGQSWTSIKGNLPDEVTNVIIQDPVNPSILYAGLDFGSYVSFDDGDEWHYLVNMPNVASYDMIVHPRDLELVVATHGRSMWVMDVVPLHQVAERLDEAITAIKPESVRHSNRWGNKRAEWDDAFMPDVELIYFLGRDGMEQNVEIEVKDEHGTTVSTLETQGSHGFNTFTWNLITSENEDGFEFLQKGTYTLSFKTRRTSHEVKFEIK